MVQAGSDSYGAKDIFSRWVSLLIKNVVLWKQCSYSEAQIPILELIQGNKGPTVLYVHGCVSHVFLKRLSISPRLPILNPSSFWRLMKQLSNCYINSPATMEIGTSLIKIKMRYTVDLRHFRFRFTKEVTFSCNISKICDVMSEIIQDIEMIRWIFRPRQVSEQILWEKTKAHSLVDTYLYKNNCLNTQFHLPVF